METKTCKRCGKQKPIVDFRSYYGVGQKGSYTFCKECERIESRRKYLLRQGDRLTDKQRQALEAIEQLYARRKEQGLAVPTTRGSNTTDSIVAKQLEEARR